MRVLLKSRVDAQAAEAETVLSVDMLRIGRGADQHVLLNDLRVALAHAELKTHHGLMGKVLRIESLSRSGVVVNGVTCPVADLAVGDTLDFGRFRLTVGRSVPGYDVVLQIEERYAGHDERQMRRAALKTTLAQTGWSPRRMAWTLGLALLALGLLIPMLSLIGRSAEPVQAADQRSLSKWPGTDILWDSGPLSSAHQALKNDCGVCHQKPFQRVTDAACRDCHRSLNEHAAVSAVLSAAPFDGQRCTDCHREHNGAHALTPADNTTCVDCHQRGYSSAGRTIEAVTDWSRHHPAFSISLPRKKADGHDWVDVRQDMAEARREDAGLKYPHDVHLSPKGVDAPGGRRVMQCKECHQATPDGAGFRPIEMKTHCVECHKLDFDLAEPGRELPHGKPEEVVKVVRDYYARVALAGDSPATRQERRRPGQTLPPQGARAALEWADAQADLALRDVFERRTCFYCHEVSKDGTPAAPWRIAPVAAQKLAFHASVFPHDRHATEKCESCHAAEGSKKSEEVLLPDIQKCRDCHGDTGAMSETPSSCQSCHDYHQHPLLPVPKP